MSEWTPAVKDVQAAMLFAAANPSVLARTFQYALMHLRRELHENPEHALMAQAEGDTVHLHMQAVLDILNGARDETGEATPAQRESAFQWMLSRVGYFDDYQAMIANRPCD